MKKILLLAIAREREAALAALRDTGVMHLDVRRSEPTERSVAAAEKFRAALQVENRLNRFAEGRAEKVSGAAFVPDRSDAEYLAGCEALFERFDALCAERAGISQQLKKLAAWGNFRRSMIDDLARRGIFLLLCRGTQNDLLLARQKEDVCVVVAKEDRRHADFVVIADHALDENDFPAAKKLAVSDDPALLEVKLQSLEKEIAAVETKLLDYTRAAERIAAARAALLQEAEFCRALDACEDHDAVLLLTGFVPEPSIGLLREAAVKNGWGLVISDPAPEDDVPVLIRETRWSRTIQPLFNFLGILPGYREMDISGGVLIFFTVFYAMIIGDAGYGGVFLLASIAASFRFRRCEKAKVPLKLAWVLSLATLAWGALSGNWFGVNFGGLKCLTDPAVKDGWIQMLCFALAVIQLSLGHVWKAIHDGNWKSIGANVGWMLIIWGNFFLAMRIIVFPGDFPVYMYYFYGAGLALVLLCGLNWRNAADIFQFPFSIIGSFSDLLSYIRLFAVGMAGSYIAANFNGMGVGVMKISPYIIPVGVLVVFCGHLLNLAMGLMSVLVHAVRLNTLEFSNHTGLTWSGNAFRPFANNPNIQNKETQK